MALSSIKEQVAGAKEVAGKQKKAGDLNGVCRGLNINPREYLEESWTSNQKFHELLPDEWLKGRHQKLVS